MKQLKMNAIALMMALLIAASPVMVLAQNNTQTQPVVQQTILANQSDEILNMFYEMIGVELRLVTLTPEAQDLVLYDLDYLFTKILEIAPTQNILQRRFGIGAEDFFAIYKNFVYENTSLPSLMSILDPVRWEEESTDTLYIAADYIFTLLFLMQMELGGLGHFTIQDIILTQQMFLQSAIIGYHGIELSQEDIDLVLGSGVTLEQIEVFIDASLRFQQLHYDIYNTPSVLWFYDMDPSLFDMDTDLGEFLGIEDPDNITTYIIEEDVIAYVHIASFLGNMQFDNQTLLPFFEEIQHFEHLIIDLRGNGGGFTTYFPAIVFGTLVNESSHFTSYEFFIASEITEAFFVNPMSLCGGMLYDIRPAAEFVAERGFEYFNPDDLALLDYVIIRETIIVPTDEGVPFDGKIWLLVDGGSASASENAANLSAATGFATVVGEPTAGVTGVIYTFAALPNTGLLFRIDLGYTIDAYGRSLEEFGFIPHIFNMDGMDALETVLSIIHGDVMPQQTAESQQTVRFTPPPWPEYFHENHIMR